MPDHKNNKYLLVELLKEDQEPFNLNNYLSDCRRRNIHLNNNSRPLHQQKHDHVGFSNSKLSDFLSTPTTPTSSVFLNIPARTSAWLSKTSMRIKRHSKPRNQMKDSGVGLFSSVLKKRKDGEQSKKMEFFVEEGESSSRRSSSSPSRKSFGWSPLDLSPFSWSSGRRSPVSSSPIISPSRRQKKETHAVKRYSKRYNKREESTTTTSPISVLDRPSFENEHDNDDDHHAHYNSTFPNLHSAKEEELLSKLLRFEKVVNLDPIELEKTAVKQLYYHNETESAPDNNNQQTYELEGNGDDILLGGVLGNKMEYYCLEERDESSINNIDHMVLMINDHLMNQWTRCQDEEREETGMQIEVAIFSLLVEELALDLILP